MASTNPLFVLPGALAENMEKVATGLFNSVTLGAGQFCTKPGLVFVPEGMASERFAILLKDKVSASAEFTLLTAGISRSFAKEAAAREENAKLRLVAKGKPPGTGLAAGAAAALYETELRNLWQDEQIAAEHFGPSTVLIRYQSKSQILECAKNLSGHLTATIHGTAEDLAEHADLIQILADKVGRIICNGFPTGVEVTHAMVHGDHFRRPAIHILRPWAAWRSCASRARFVIRIFPIVCCRQSCKRATPWAFGEWLTAK